MPKMNPCSPSSSSCFQVLCLFFNLQFVKNPPSRDNLTIVNHLIQERNNAAGIRGEAQPWDRYCRKSDTPTSCAMLPIFNVFCIFQ